jgi:biopolymer transport protein ExbD
MAGADMPAAGGKGGRRISIHIDMTPMVDVIILLLIFFFMTSQFKEPAAVEVTLPSLEKSEPVKVKESNVLTVKVDDAGNIMIVDTRNREGKELSVDELGDYIGSRQQENEDLITIIDVSPEAEYSRMMDVLDEFKIASEETGVKKISLQLEEFPETAATAEAEPGG